jgi:3-oxoacyl-[acyl-carrier-protein] synthase II
VLAAPRDVVVTGIGAVSALAGDVPGLWEAVASGRQGIGPIGRFPTGGFRVHTGAVVGSCAGPRPGDPTLSVALCRDFALAAGREALSSAGLDEAPIDPARIALVFGSGLGDLAAPIHTIAVELAEALGIAGPRLTVSTACSSSTGAIGLGRELLALHAADVVLAGGADVLSPEVFAGFHALGVLTPDACAPFSLPFGTTLGEGAGFLVLERGTDARRRGAAVFVNLAGFGLSGDAYHETSPDPKGAGVERAIRAALGDAALGAVDIGYVNAHGSGTEANDPAEWRGIQRALGHHAGDIPVSSTKGALGHAQGAAGALEAIVTIEAMTHDAVPPTLNFTTARRHAPSDPVPGPRPRPGAIRHALSLNAAFGGANAALVLSRTAGERVARARRPVHALGLGLVGPWGLASDATGAGKRTGAVPPFDLAPLVPNADPRGLDPMTRFLTAAAALALRDAGIALRGALRDRAGLLVGQLEGSPSSHADFRRSIDEHGLAHLSATAFARIVLNAAAGACSKLLALRGPLTAISTGAGSGLVAIVLAAELLSTRDDVDLMVAGGVDECRDDGGGEGAACVLLGTDSAGRNGGIRLLGWAVAGPDRRGEVERRALAMDDTSAAPPVRFDVEAHADAMASARTVAEAVSALRRGDAARALVTSDAGTAASAALLLGCG